MSDISDQFPPIITTMITTSGCCELFQTLFTNGAYTYTYTACEINTHTTAVWYPNQLTT